MKNIMPKDFLLRLTISSNFYLDIRHIMFKNQIQNGNEKEMELVGQILSQRCASA